MHSMTHLFGFSGVGMFSVYCSVQKLLRKRKIIVIDADFTEIFKIVGIIVFGVCFPVENKVLG